MVAKLDWSGAGGWIGGSLIRAWGGGRLAFGGKGLGLYKSMERCDKRGTSPRKNSKQGNKTRVSRVQLFC